MTETVKIHYQAAKTAVRAMLVVTDRLIEKDQWDEAEDKLAQCIAVILEIKKSEEQA